MGFVASIAIYLSALGGRSDVLHTGSKDGREAGLFGNADTARRPEKESRWYAIGVLVLPRRAEVV